MKKFYFGFLLMLLLTVWIASTVFADSSEHLLTEAEQIDAVSHATGRISNWIELYPTYGILVVTLPQEDGYQWDIVFDENKADAVKILKIGVANHTWYAGLKAVALDAIIKVRFELTGSGKLIESRYIDLLIQNYRISEVIDYGIEKQKGFVIAGKRPIINHR